MIQHYDYEDLGGGVNLGAAPAQIPSKQMAALENWYPYNTRLRRRGGVRRLTTGSAWSQNITGMFPLKLANGTWALLVGGPTAFGKYNESTLAVDDLTLGSGVVFPASTLPWTFFQYKNYAYAMRRNAGTMIRLTETSANRGGITAPTAAATIAQGAAGALPSGDYRTVYTYFNRATELESNPSPVSNTLSLGASRQIDYTGITASSDPFVDARRIYRTLEDQVGVYFFVDQIDDNVVTTYTGDQVLVADLGRTVSFNNGLPPSQLELGSVWNERLFATDGVDLFFSELLLVECFGDENVIPVFPDDGHRIRALHAFGDRLVIGKTNKVHYLVGTDASSFGIQTLSDKHGCMSHHSMHSAESVLFWYGSGKAVFRSDGTSVTEISNPQVKPLLEAIPDELEEYVVGGVFPSRNWYVLSIPQAAGANNSKVVVYNYKYNTWTVFTHPSDAPQFLQDFFTESYGHVLYSTFYDGHLYHYADDDYTSDFGNDIVATLTTKADDFGHPSYPKYLTELRLLIPQVNGETILIEVLGGSGSAISSRSGSLDITGDDWKYYKLHTAGAPQSKLQTRLTYSGAPMIDLDQIHFVAGMVNRTMRRLS